MTILDGYLFKRLLVVTAFGILIFTIAWIAPEMLFRAIKSVSQGTFSPGQGLAYLFYQMPEVLSYCLPISALFASVFLFRQLSLSSELTAILASGISFRRILIPVALVGLLVSGAYWLNQEVYAPWAAHNLRELNRKTQFDDRLVVNPHVTFLERTTEGLMDKFMVVLPEAKEGEMKFVFLFYRQGKNRLGIDRILTANRGKWDPDQEVWNLFDTREYQVSDQGYYSQIIEQPKALVKTSPVAHKLLSFPLGKASEFKTFQLSTYVNLLKQGGQDEDARFFQVRLFQRFFLPWATLVLAVLGAAIGIERSRSKRNLGLTYAAVLLLLYNVMIPSFTTFGSMGMLPSVMAAAMPVVLVTIIGLGIIRLRRCEG